jgi:hypothetical protein
MIWLFTRNCVKKFVGANCRRIIRIGCGAGLGALFLFSSVASAQDAAIANGANNSKRGGLYIGIGTMASGNYSKDMKNFLSYSSDKVTGQGNWLVFDIAYTQRLFSKLYLVPEIVWASSSVKTTLEGFEATPNEKGAGLFQFGGGLRYYFFDGKNVSFFVQPGLRMVTGYSDFDGFPMKSNGPAKELKGGVEWIRGHLRMGLEGGYASIPMKKPLNQDYINRYYTPTDALGGNYGGVLFALNVSYWW